MNRPVSPGQPPAEQVLAVYGTLRPGEVNFEVVAGLGGRWLSGVVRGHVGVKRSDPYQGFPAFVAADHGPAVAVSVLVSDDLPAHWARLDEFEGPGYRRVVRAVAVEDGEFLANVYELVDSSELCQTSREPGELT